MTMQRNRRPAPDIPASRYKPTWLEMEAVKHLGPDYLATAKSLRDMGEARHAYRKAHDFFHKAVDLARLTDNCPAHLRAVADRKEGV